MTLRLYYADSYIRSFTAKVVGREEGGRRVYLDQTAFYPASGGQPHDRGTLGNADVMDVIDEEDRVVHLLDRPLDGAVEVQGSIDWNRRFDHMQQHTGQHLLSAICDDVFGWPTISVHFGDDSSTIDVDAASASAEQLRAIESRANAAVTRNLPVVITLESAETLLGLRKPSERTGTLRVVSIEGLDRSACGGTHVRHTGEIGAILLGKVERVKQKVRIEFRCGARAIGRARIDADALATIARQFSASAADVPALIDRLREEHRTERARRQQLTVELASVEATALVGAATSGADGVRRISVIRSDLDSLRALAQACTEHPRVLFVGVAQEEGTVVVATSSDSGLHAGALLKPLLAAHGGRGGGSTRFAQAVAEPPALGLIVQAALKAI